MSVKLSVFTNLNPVNFTFKNQPIFYCTKTSIYLQKVKFRPAMTVCSKTKSDLEMKDVNLN